MSPGDKLMTFRPDADIFEAMTELKKRDGMPFSEQVRRALRLWLEAKEVLLPKTSARARVRARNRSHPNQPKNEVIYSKGRRE